MQPLGENWDNARYVVQVSIFDRKDGESVARVWTYDDEPTVGVVAQEFGPEGNEMYDLLADFYKTDEVNALNLRSGKI